MTQTIKLQILTANDLLTGEVVYLANDGTWVGSFTSAASSQKGEAADALFAKAEATQDQVVGIYLTDVRLNQAGELEPIHFREGFRAIGPSNYFHGKQAVA